MHRMAFKENWYQKLDDWYKVSVNEVINKGGSAILAQYGKSIGQILCSLYPEHPWDIWKLDRVPTKYWENIENQRRFMDQLANQLNVKQLNDWYKVKPIDIASRGGASFLQYHSNSLGLVVSTVFPEHRWHLWKFGTVPKGYWENKENVLAYFDWLVEQHGIQHVLNEWVKLPRRSKSNLRQIAKTDNIFASIAFDKIDNSIFEGWISNSTKDQFRNNFKLCFWKASSLRSSESQIVRH